MLAVALGGGKSIVHEKEVSDHDQRSLFVCLGRPFRTAELLAVIEVLKYLRKPFVLIVTTAALHTGTQRWLLGSETLQKSRDCRFRGALDSEAGASAVSMRFASQALGTGASKAGALRIKMARLLGR